ncbi:ricin B lectin domain-containing protein [Mycena vulgaris]|nr:ricin B lectin domain-containing protein [Mycena vulgaris]
MISSALVVLAFALSATAIQIQSSNPAFLTAGIRGCISTPRNDNGSPAVIHNCITENNANHDWQLTFFSALKATEGPQPISIFGDKCLDVTGGVNAEGTKLQIWTCAAGNGNQQWISVNDFTLQWAGTNKCIDLTGGVISDGTPLQLWECDSNNGNHQWLGVGV